MTPSMLTTSSVTVNRSIPWSEIGTRELTDSQGRVFRWKELKNKTIYLCGHGAHIYKDGYCSVPDDTAVNFYQTYGETLLNRKVHAFVSGKETWEPERSFAPGRSCPNMTLFDDEATEITSTDAALAQRLKNAPDKEDHYVFYCNLFTGLKQYLSVVKPGHPQHEFHGKQILKLSEILDALKGNRLEWVCCQDVSMERNRYLVRGQAHTFGKLREEEAGAAYLVNEPWMKAKLALFSLTVQTGLKAATFVSAKIRAEYNPSGDRYINQTRHLEGTVVSTPHGSSSRKAGSYLERKRAGDTQELIARMRELRQQIMAALDALANEPQPGPPDEHPWANATLLRGLRTADQFLNQPRKPSV